jgi:hypothetical protein
VQTKALIIWHTSSNWPEDKHRIGIFGCLFLRLELGQRKIYFS